MTTYTAPSQAATDRAAESAWRAQINGATDPEPRPDPTHDPGVVLDPNAPRP